MLLLKDRQLPEDFETQLDDLLRQLRMLPDFEQVELVPQGNSVVRALVPARNKRQIDHLKDLANHMLRGWHVIEEQSYDLPQTF